MKKPDVKVNTWVDSEEIMSGRAICTGFRSNTGQIRPEEAAKKVGQERYLHTE